LVKKKWEPLFLFPKFCGESSNHQYCKYIYNFYNYDDSSFHHKNLEKEKGATTFFLTKINNIINIIIKLNFNGRIVDAEAV
jgi:hypothetical protein